MVVTSLDLTFEWQPSMKTFELFNKVITGELYSLSAFVLEIEND